MSKRQKHKKTTASSRIRLADNAPSWQWITLILLSFILYINTLQHDYAQDDAIVITENEYTQEGFSGILDIFTEETFVGYFGRQKNLVEGGRYRPLSLVTFALEVELFGMDRPEVSHFINVLLYAITGLVLYFVLFRLFRHPRFKAYQLCIPFLACLVFLAHPVHTEAVANIKGRDEILSLLFSLSALLYVMKYISSKKTGQLMGAGILFFLGLLSKENAYTFVAIIPFTLYFFTDQKVNEITKNSILFFIIAIVGFLIRYSVLSGVNVVESQELMNNPFLNTTFSERLATVMFTLGKYIQLLFVPYALTHDYYPFHIDIMRWGNPLVLLSTLLYLGMLLFALYGFKKKSLVAYGIWFYLFSLFIVSNIPVSVGVFMSERFLFMPSVGFALIMAFFLANIHSWLVLKRMSSSSQWFQVGERANNFFRFFYQKQKIGFLLAVFILAAYSFKTIDRNPAWKSSEMLFLTDVETSKGSAKVNNAAGGALFDKAMTEPEPAKKRAYLEKSLEYINRALKIHPSYHAAWVTHGSLHYYLYNNIDQAIASYLNGGGQGLQNFQALAIMELEKGNADGAIKILDRLIEIQPQNDLAFTKRGLAYARGKNNLQRAVADFNSALTINPNNAEALENLGVAHAFQGQHQRAIEYFERALQINPNDPNLYENMGRAYSNLGDEQRGHQYLQQAQALRNGRQVP